MARGPKDMPPRDQRGGGLVPDDRPESLAYAETQAGLRCAGCGRRLGKLAYEFTRLEVVRPALDLKAKPMVGIHTLIACARPDCDYALTCAKLSVAVRRLESRYLFLDNPKVAELFGLAEETEETPDGGE